VISVQVNLARLRRVQDGIEEFYFQETHPPLEVGSDLLVFEDKVNLSLKIAHSENSFAVEGCLQTALRVVCCRCLREFTLPIDFLFDDVWVLAEDLREDQIDTAFVMEKDEADITERITEHLIMNLPMRFVCSESCRGLCPSCGNDLNINECYCREETADPRLSKLANWNKE